MYQVSVWMKMNRFLQYWIHCFQTKVTSIRIVLSYRKPFSVSFEWIALIVLFVVFFWFMISLLKRQGPKWISTFNQKSLYPIVCGISNYSINKSSWCLFSTSKDDSTSFQNTSEPKTAIKKKRVPLVNVSELSVDDICSLLKSRSISNEDVLFAYLKWLLDWTYIFCSCLSR